MNSGDHSTSYVLFQDTDFPSADGGVNIVSESWKLVKLLITGGY
jgi:hypothetical protein